MNKKGFTLIETLVVISIISFLASMGMYYFNVARAKARDAERVQTLQTFRKSLELYYDDHDSYPPAGGKGWCEYEYSEYSEGACAPLFFEGGWPAGGELRFDNSASLGFLNRLYPDYISIGTWNDPLNPHWEESTLINPLYNCRYIVLTSEADPNGDDDYSDFNVQRYLLHCKLELSSDWEKNDVGIKDNLYEIIVPDPWICVTKNPGE